MSEEGTARTVIVLNTSFVEAVRGGLIYDETPELGALRGVLADQKALVNFSQLDEFDFHLASAEAHGVTDDAFRAWTRHAMSMPPAAAKLGRTFSVAVGGDRVYDESVAVALETALKPLEGQGVVDQVRVDRQGDGPKVPAQYYIHVAAPIVANG